tara:strand:- start:129 stop:929 length:801 start_codon:yes stop_codon:yes gene_type:complete
MLPDTKWYYKVVFSDKPNDWGWVAIDKTVGGTGQGQNALLAQFLREGINIETIAWTPSSEVVDDAGNQVDIRSVSDYHQLTEAGPDGKPTYGDEGFGIEQQFPMGAYRAALGTRGVPVGQGPFSQYVTSQFAPSASTFTARAGLGREGFKTTDDLSRAFQTYIEGTPLSEIPRQALEAFTDMVTGKGAGRLSEDQAAILSAFSNPTDDFQRQQAATLATTAAAGKYSPFAASRLLPSPSALSQEWQADPTQSWLPFLQKRVGLGSI